MKCLMKTVCHEVTQQSFVCLRNYLTYFHTKDLGEGMYVYTYNLYIYICINKTIYFVEDSKSKGPLSFLTPG